MIWNRLKLTTIWRRSLTCRRSTLSRGQLSHWKWRSVTTSSPPPPSLVELWSSLRCCCRCCCHSYPPSQTTSTFAGGQLHSVRTRWSHWFDACAVPPSCLYFCFLDCKEVRSHTQNSTTSIPVPSCSILPSIGEREAADKLPWDRGWE